MMCAKYTANKHEKNSGYKKEERSEQKKHFNTERHPVKICTIQYYSPCWNMKIRLFPTEMNAVRAVSSLARSQWWKVTPRACPSASTGSRCAQRRARALSARRWGMVQPGLSITGNRGPPRSTTLFPQGWEKNTRLLLISTIPTIFWKKCMIFELFCFL